jgi:dihydropteroate synthase
MANNLIIRNHSFQWGLRTYLMGVLNITPDSFSDGGEFNTINTALNQAREMIASGADILDIGGQSTRPGAKKISLAEELHRVIPIIQELRKEIDRPISIDTTRAEVAKEALKVGADIINDISGGTFEPEILSVAAKYDVPIILMHIRGNPENMQKMIDYEDVIQEIRIFLEQQIERAIAVGVKKEKIIIDPGIGFAKNYEQNIEIFRRLGEFKDLRFPILVGPSRKSFIGRILNQPDPKARVWGTAAACCAAIFTGADILRIHDVQEMRDVSLVADALLRLSSTPSCDHYH